MINDDVIVNRQMNDIIINYYIPAGTAAGSNCADCNRSASSVDVFWRQVIIASLYPKPNSATLPKTTSSIRWTPADTRVHRCWCCWCLSATAETMKGTIRSLPGHQVYGWISLLAVMLIRYKFSETNGIIQIIIITIMPICLYCTWCKQRDCTRERQRTVDGRQHSKTLY